MKKPLAKKVTDLQKKDVIIANSIIRSAQGFTLVEKRIIFAGIAKLGCQSKEVKLTGQEFAETFGIALNTAYEQLKSSVETLRKRYITFPMQSERNKTGTAVVNWLQGYVYYDSEGYVTYRFSDYVFPYLFELEDQFTKYKLSQACALRSIHSWRLLELLEQFSNTGKDGFRWLKIPIDDFHHAMETPASYRTTFGLLSLKVIKPAVKELEQKDGWCIEWSTIKRGRKVVMLEFKYKRNPQTSIFDETEAADKVESKA